MAKKVKITPGMRRYATIMRREALKTSLPFEKELEKKRTALINSIAAGLADLPPVEWTAWAADQINEPYLPEWYRRLYMAIGEPAGEAEIRHFLNIKAAPDMNTWQRALYDWIGAEMGDRIVLVSGTLKEWTINTLLQYMDENAGQGVEQITQGVQAAIREKWTTAKEWQIRRIVQTESLTALSEAGDLAIKQLRINYRKTWGISGRNTRPAHQVMDGVTIGQNELFVVDGELLEFPRDYKHGASAGNVINCACFCIRTPIAASGADLTDADFVNMV